MSDQDLLDAVEAWAQPHGYLVRTSEFNHESSLWALDGHEARNHGGNVLIQRRGLPGTAPNYPHAWCVDAWTAALWALLVDAKLAFVDVGGCPACRGTRKAYTGLMLVQCSACTTDDKPTGRDLRDPAQLLLDAAPQEIDEQTRIAFFGYDPATGLAQPDASCYTSGDPDARTQLAVLADKLTAEGSELGELLAVWLAPLESGARDQLRPLLLWLVRLAAVRSAQGDQLDMLTLSYTRLQRYRSPSDLLLVEADSELRARVEYALRESRPKRITHARTPQSARSSCK